MNTAPSRAATNASGRNRSANPPSAVPTSTGATAAGSVRGRAAISQIRIPPPTGLWPLGELREVGCALVDVRVAPLLCLGRAVEEEVRVVRELLQAREPVL